MASRRLSPNIQATVVTHQASPLFVAFEESPVVAPPPAPAPSTLSSPPPRHWSVAAAIGLTALATIGLVMAPGSVRPLASQASEAAKPADGFRPTKEQWAGLKVGTVDTKMFLPEQVSDGNIAIDDDLTTPVFSPYTGRVTRLYAKLGDMVARGAPLFAVDATEFVQAQNDLITALATLRTGHGQQAQSQTNEKRAHELYLANGGSLKDWQQAQTDLAAAQNTVRADEIALAAVRNRLRILGKSDREIAALEAQPTQRLDPTTIVPAPIGGTITQRQVGLGQYINSAANGATGPIYTIGDLSTVWLVANVREADAPRMRLGESVEVRVLALPGRVFKARLSYVAASIDPGTHRLSVRADVDNPTGELKPSMFAGFRIATGEATAAPAVPEGAVIYEGEAARVWIVRDDGSIAARAIRTGQTSDGMVEVLDGLSSGDKIVTAGTLFIDRAASSD